METADSTFNIETAHRTAPVRISFAIEQRFFEQFFNAEAKQGLQHLEQSGHCHIEGAIEDGRWLDQLITWDPEVIVTCWNTPPLPENVVQLLPHLRYVCQTVGKVRDVVPRSFLEMGGWVSNWGGLAAPTVAECALTLILASLRQVGHWQEVMKHQQGWRKNGMLEPGNLSLFGRKVGIHGCGQVARELVRLLQPFHVQIGCHSLGVPENVIRNIGAQPVSSLERLFGHHEIIVEAEAAIPGQPPMITERLLRLLPRPAVFVNVARGCLVDEEALYRVGTEGWLRLGLDVYTKEPLPVDSPLRRLPQSVLLPHLAGPTIDQMHFLGQHAIENLTRYVNGETPVGLLTLEMYDRMT